MQLFSRTLLAVDILSEEMAELLDESSSSEEDFIPPEEYLQHLTKVIAKLKELQVLSADMKDSEIQSLTKACDACQLITSKTLLTIYPRLLKCVLDYYQAIKKARGLSQREYDLDSDERLTLFQNRAYKARNLYKAVAEPLGKVECKRFVRHFALPVRDWSLT